MAEVDGAKIPVISINEAGLINLPVTQFKIKVIEHYPGDWERFFKEFRAEANKSLELIAQQNAVTHAQNKSLYEQNLQLKGIIQEQTAKIEFIESEARIQKAKREENEL